MDQSVTSTHRTPDFATGLILILSALASVTAVAHHPVVKGHGRHDRNIGRDTVMVSELGRSWSRAASDSSRRRRRCARTAFCFDLGRSDNYGAHDSSNRWCNGSLVFCDRLPLNGTANISLTAWQRRPYTSIAGWTFASQAARAVLSGLAATPREPRA